MKGPDGRNLGAEAQEAIRLRIAAFLKDKRGTQRQAADIFQVSLGGEKSLLTKKRGTKTSR